MHAQAQQQQNPECDEYCTVTASCGGCGARVCTKHSKNYGLEDWACKACEPKFDGMAARQRQVAAEARTLVDMPSSAWARALRLVHDGKVLVVTGAGVSAESGIPTFRSVDGTGLYESGDWNPTQFLRHATVEHYPEKLWEYYLDRFSTAMHGKEPNPAHLSIAYLESYMRDTGGEFLLVTQNIDGLHIAAGNSPERCIELHGDKRMRCSDECWLRNNGEVPKLLPIPKGAEFPDDVTCPDCGAFMRPHVLLFDEHYSQELYRSREANEFAMEADLIITVGCSAVVPVAHIMANLVVQRGGMVIDVNPADGGPLAELAEQTGVRLQGRAGLVLPKLVDFLTATA